VGFLAPEYKAQPNWKLGKFVDVETFKAAKAQ
jgi:hypothetical protein